MKFIGEFRNRKQIGYLSEKIFAEADRNFSFMEVCGGHTAAIHRFGIPSLLPAGINLLSGPGCPVCVTSIEYIDRLIAYSRLPDVIITTFGDLIRIPGSASSLERERASGSDIRIVFSGLDALEIARLNPQKKILFPGIGFETTAPGTAVTIKQAGAEGLKNFMVLTAHKLMPPAMEAVVQNGARIDGFICPGHVAAVTGSGIFGFIPGKYGLGCVISGFEPVDLLQSILMLVKQVKNNSPEVEIQYLRAVRHDGNIQAVRHMEDVFETEDTIWRGFGMIPGSGLRIREDYRSFDASSRLPVQTEPYTEAGGCICGDILRGLKKPQECNLFRTVCSPVNPVGACMVSAEGTCNSYFKYLADE